MRRDLHAHPELRFQEVRTAAKVAAELEGYVDSLTAGIGGTGILARVNGAEPGKTVLIRSDMDAYPVADAKDVDYHSQNPGVTHACGHDVHVTCLLGAAALLVRARERWAGTLVALFQPAEETGDGAQAMVEDDLIGLVGVSQAQLGLAVLVV